MLVIRMRRAGSKNRPLFRIVVTEAAAAREGRFVEMLGHYNPRTKPETLEMDRERYAFWMKSGAGRPTRVRTLIERTPAPRGRARRGAGGIVSRARRRRRRGGPRAREPARRSRGRRVRAARHDGRGADDGSRRPRACHRPAGPHGHGGAHAGCGSR